jgi:CheY-like chemotaxis protein
MSTVLVVDDEFGIAELIVDVLTDEGHRVVTAANGRQGLEALARERPSLVFLDYMMPVLDGAGMLRGMAEDASLNGVPVVMMSSIPEATVAERCRGYSAFMRKPFRIAEVVAMTERLLADPQSSSI